jgi:hypothetical protein
VLIQEKAVTPARRVRRWLTGVIIGLTLVLGVQVNLPEPSPALLHYTATPTPTPAPQPEQLNDVLIRQATALLAGDQPGWLAPVAATGGPVRQYKDLYQRLRTLGITSLQPVIKGDTKAGTTVSYGVCTQTVECPRADGPLSSFGPWTETFEITVAWDRTDTGTIEFTGMTVTPPPPVTKDAFPARPRVQPYLEGANLRMKSGRRTTVFAPPALAGELSQTVAAGDAAAVTDDRYAYWTRPTRYIVYLAGPTEWKNWFNGSPGIHTLAYATNDSQSSDIVVVNDALMHSTGEDLELLLRHEFGHVVTLLGGESEDDDVLTEGLADYIAYDGQPLSNYERLDELGEYLGSHQWGGDPRALDKSIFSDDPVTANAAYAMGFLTWRCVAAKYGPAKTRTFMADAVHEQFTIDFSTREAFGTTWAQISRACAPYIRGAVS